jgi:hypothetical protein
MRHKFLKKCLRTFPKEIYTTITNEIIPEKEIARLVENVSIYGHWGIRKVSVTSRSWAVKLEH